VDQPVFSTKTKTETFVWKMQMSSGFWDFSVGDSVPHGSK